MNLSSEIDIWQEVIPEANDAALQIISLYSHKGSCSNTELAYFTRSTVPVPLVGRTVSKLKIIKNYLRINLTKDKLGGLVIVFIENEVAPSTDCNESNAQSAARNWKLDSV